MKLSPEKRDAIIKVAGGFLLGLAVLWWFGVRAQQNALMDLGDKFLQTMAAADKANSYVRSGPTVLANLQAARQRLEAEEVGLVPIDRSYRRNWLLKELNNVLASTGAQVDLEVITLVEPADRNAELLPKFPYGASQFRVRMAAYYHDYGKFLAEFENRFPYLRLQDLVIKPTDAVGAAIEVADATAGTDQPKEIQVSEKLTFEFVVVALVKSLSTP